MKKPLVVITGSPPWEHALRERLSSDYDLYVERIQNGYVTRLADALAALIIVNGNDADWPFWTATPKSSPATRRIPIILISDDAAVRHASLAHGADLAVTSADLLQEAPQLARDYARVPDPLLLAELDCQCQEALPPLAVQGIEKFNDGEYYRQHDLFEELWVKTEGPVRDLYRAVLQVGVAYYQVERGNHRGALKMLLRSLQWLSKLPDVCQGIDVRQLREDSYRVRAELEALDPAEIGRFDHSLLKPVRLVENKAQAPDE